MRRIFWPLLWSALIYATSMSVVTQAQLAGAVSSSSKGAVSSDEFRAFWLSIWWIVVKGWHVVEFAILFLLLRRAIPKNYVAMLIAAVLALADELHQVSVPGRGGRFSDVLIDWMGILGVMVFGSLFHRKRWGALALCMGGAIGLIWLLSFFPFGSLEIPVDGSRAKPNHNP